MLWDAPREPTTRIDTSPAPVEATALPDAARSSMSPPPVLATTDLSDESMTIRPPPVLTVAPAGADAIWMLPPGFEIYTGPMAVIGLSST
jgi:hypothetical protein